MFEHAGIFCHSYSAWNDQSLAQTSSASTKFMAYVFYGTRNGEKGRSATSGERAGSSEFPDAIPLRLHGVPTGLGSGTNV
ncbi:MAG TPA: hypothetical protein VL485_19435 [Ktedonobacteraceae bacterium]|nr:hypothetical protein [Ktedonobacteraceae bacterium]